MPRNARFDCAAKIEEEEDEEEEVSEERQPIVFLVNIFF